MDHLNVLDIANKTTYALHIYLMYLQALPASVTEKRNPQVYFDITVGKQEIGRIIMMLRADVVPRTAENFRALCTHEMGFGYQGCRFHRIIPDFVSFSKLLHTTIDAVVVGSGKHKLKEI